MKQKKILPAFTLIEIMVWIMIISIVIVWGFKALTAITIWKVKIIQQTDIQKESFYFTEKLFEMVKKWWTLDYEEYFNRSMVWNTDYASGHFADESWFGNFWIWWSIWSNTYGSEFYYCASWIGIANKLDWTGCSAAGHQRYWEYSFQFIDYNSNYDADWWDENWDTDIRFDDDDEYIWDWPEVFTAWTIMPELYLISWDKRERTLFRWSVKSDINSWGLACSIDAINNTITWSWCIWNVEYLKLEWVDWGLDHGDSPGELTEYDWVIDTWLLHKDFQLWGEVAWKSNVNWVSLFPESINVTEFNVRSYPNKDILLAWNNIDESLNISPYIIINIKLKPSWESRTKLKWAWKELEFSMTINLTDIYSQ